MSVVVGMDGNNVHDAMSNGLTVDCYVVNVPAHCCSTVPDRTYKHALSVCLPVHVIVSLCFSSRFLPCRVTSMSYGSIRHLISDHLPTYLFRYSTLKNNNAFILKDKVGDQVLYSLLCI